MTMRIASRGSALALWQAGHVRDLLLRLGAEEPEILVVHTTGDHIRDVPLARIGDRGLFTREVDDALLDGRAELAVHSLKDIPTVMPAGLEIVAILEREDPADVLVCRPDLRGGLADLPPGTRIGTSSLRRRAQLSATRPDLEVVDLRGNLDTRLRKVRDGQVDAAILARAGLLRLERDEEAREVLPPPTWLPAVGQGALAVVMRSDADAALVERLDHLPSRIAAVAERAFLRRLEGGCQVPIGAVGHYRVGSLELFGGVFSLDGSVALRGSMGDDGADPAALGAALAERLIADGANEVLRDIRERTRPRIPAP